MALAESLDEPLLAELYHYWSGRRGGRIAPARSDIDPVDIPHLLPHLMLSDIVTDGPDGARRVQFRLAGTKIEARIGCSLRNRFLDELKKGAYLKYVFGLYEKVIGEKTPVFSENGLVDADGSTVTVKRLLLPLSKDAETVDMVLAGLIYADGNPGQRTTVTRSQHEFTPYRLEAG